MEPHDTPDDIELGKGDAALLELAKNHPIETQMVARDLRAMEQLFGDPVTRPSAELTVQAWADGADSLRKAFAGAWLGRARATAAAITKDLSHRAGNAGAKAGEAMAGAKSAAGRLHEQAGAKAGQAMAGAKVAAGRLHESAKSEFTATKSDAKDIYARAKVGVKHNASDAKQAWQGAGSHTKAAIVGGALGAGAGVAAVATAKRTKVEKMFGGDEMELCKAFGSVELADLAEAHPIETQIVARDLQAMQKLYANDATREAADLTVQAWADGAPSLRKAFASAWLNRARGALASGASAAGSAAKTVGSAAKATGAVAIGAAGRVAKAPGYVKAGLGGVAGAAAVDAVSGSSDDDKDDDDHFKAASNDGLEKGIGGWLNRARLAVKSPLRGAPPNGGWKGSEKLAVGVGAGAIAGGALVAGLHRGGTEPGEEEPPT